MAGESKLTKVAENAALQVAARGAMLVMLPLMIWIGSTLVDIKVELAEQKRDIAGQEKRLERLEAWRDRGFSPQYR